MKKAILAAACAGLLLSACDTLDLRRPVSDSSLASVHRIAVVSLLGDDVHFVTRGLTIFGNSRFDASFPDWQIDRAAQDHALADLSRSTAYTAAPLERDGLSEQALSADGGRAALDLAQRQGFDTVLVIHPGVSENFAYLPPGIGVFNHTLPGISPHPAAYSGFVVSVVSVSERKQKAWQWGGEIPFEMKRDQVVPMHDRFDQFTDDEKSQLHEGIVARVDKGIDEALSALRLAPAPRS